MKKEISVTVVYPMASNYSYIEENIDKIITNIKRTIASPIIKNGSGTDFVNRDIHYCFSTKKQIIMFKTALSADFYKNASVKIYV